MKKFEIGSVYYDCGISFKVISRTAKFLTVEIYQHYGRYNEVLMDTARLKIRDWKTREVFYYHDGTIQADCLNVDILCYA